jgi:hypothetical protein
MGFWEEVIALLGFRQRQAANKLGRLPDSFLLFAIRNGGERNTSTVSQKLILLFP